MTALDKRKPKRLLPWAAAMRVRASVQAVPASAWASVVSLLVWGIAIALPVAILQIGLTVDPAWVMPLSVLSARP
jgi:hypothetical protein